MRTDVFCIGEPMLEFNQQPDGSYKPGHGGDTSNVACAAARQGARVGYFTALGADPFGQSFLDLWAREGVDASSVKQIPDAATAVYFVTHGADGHAFSYFRAGSAASRMHPADLPQQALESAQILHVSGISQAISESAADTVFAAIETVKAHGGLVSYDTNLRLKLWPLDRARAVIHAGVSRSDIALPGLEDACALTGLSDPDAIVDFYLGLGPKIVALTLGPDGVLVADAQRRRMITGRAVACVDATGAGDTFDGAFLARIAAGDDAFDAAHYANAAAALAVQGYGAVEPMPYRDDVEAALHA